jgi:hypothetical protein
MRLFFAELLIDCEEDRILRAVLVGITSGAAPRLLPVAWNGRQSLSASAYAE